MPARLRQSLMILGLVVPVFTVPVAQAAEDDIEQRFEVQPGGRFVLDVDAGSVDVRTGSDGEVAVTVRNPDDMDVSFSQTGDEVRVDGAREGRRERIRTSFIVTVPRQFNVEVDTAGGSIDIEELQGTVSADTAGGSISIGDTAGDVTADTAGGSITIGDVDGSVVADTSGGSIKVGNVTGNAELDTSGGSITVGEVGGDASVRTAGGSITAGSVRGVTRLDTAGGSIRLEGGGSQVRVETSGGSITVRQADGPTEARTAGGSITLGPIAGSINARTAGGSIEGELAAGASGDTRITMISSGGDIELRLPRDHRGTVDAHIEVSRRYRGDYRIYTDFPLTVQGEEDRDVTARGDINGGGDLIRLETIDGDIHIRRSN